MSDPFEEYEYTLPQGQIAHEPMDERDLARLFIYDTNRDRIVFDQFKNIAQYLPNNGLMTLNETRVSPARISGERKGGRGVTFLLLVGAAKGMFVPALTKQKLHEDEEIFIHGVRTFMVAGRLNGIWHLHYVGPQPLMALLEEHGRTPMPPYIKSALPESTLRARYQTIFANSGASAAAPTASLHFTPAVFETLDAARIERAMVSLDVGLGTFAPVRDEQLGKNELHEEFFRIPHESIRKIRKAKESARPVIAVGTTVVRTLESAFPSILNASFIDTDIESSTKLFIRPGFEFMVTDHLITNFHVPRSSLMSLVDAFLVHKGSKRRILELYRVAIKERFRFYSFGDSMLII